MHHKANCNRRTQTRPDSHIGAACAIYPESRYVVDAYTRFIHALCEMAKTQKRVTAQERPTKSEKYAFRCFLLRLGFIGSDFASARKVLLANLSGNGSKSGREDEVGGCGHGE